MTRTIAILAAVLPKMRWSAFRPAWLEWAAVAAIVSLLIERTVLAITHQSLGAEIDFSQYPLSPMAPMAFASCLSIAILCDVDLGLGQGWARRVTEVLLSSVAMIFAIFVCTHLLAIPSSHEGANAVLVPGGLRRFRSDSASGFFYALPLSARSRRGRGLIAAAHA